MKFSQCPKSELSTRFYDLQNQVLKSYFSHREKFSMISRKHTVNAQIYSMKQDNTVFDQPVQYYSESMIKNSNLKGLKSFLRFLYHNLYQTVRPFGFQIFHPHLSGRLSQLSNSYSNSLSKRFFLEFRCKIQGQHITV